MSHGTRILARRAYQTVLIGAASAAVGGASDPTTSVLRRTKLDYWEHDRRDFDLYIEKPNADDLPLLLREFQAGKEVWPWIWCQPNPNGPHHVFVGSLTDAVLQQIQKLLENRQNNILIVTTPEELARVPSKMVEKCGIVTDASVQLVNTKDKILMLDDERVISFDHLITTSSSK